MCFEVSYSRCQGRVLIETSGTLTACPSLDLHLTIIAAKNPLTGKSEDETTAAIE